MDVARPDFVTKSRAVISSVTRKTSCSSGRVRMVLQTIFAIITVSSFILIVLMSVRNSHSGWKRPTVPSRCRINGCSVYCYETLYSERFEEDILHTLLKADNECSRVHLVLNAPIFTNGTLPHTWLSTLRLEVYALSIIGGNLMHIPSGAFMAQFMGTVKSLVLQDLTIKTFEPTSLVGLSSLRSFSIINCLIDDVQQNALRAVDDTLETLTVTESGKWDPIVFTGSKGFKLLTIVDFSYNDFGQTLNEQSFVGLDQTKILYLNFCKITSIDAGTFDHLERIEVLYLNNNMLSTVPPGLFDSIAILDNPRPRINLQDNNWFCDCSVDDLRQLVRKELLLVEVQCMYPDELNSMSFTEFEHTCSNETYMLEKHNSSMKDNSTAASRYHDRAQSNSSIVSINGQYCGSNVKSSLPKIKSPLKINECSSKNFNNLKLLQQVENFTEIGKNESKWLRFSYFLKTNSFSVVQIRALSVPEEYGLIWYQISCPYDIFCLDVLPLELKLYGADPNARYIFCPIYMKTGKIKNDDCIDISVEKQIAEERKYNFNVLIYIITVILCLSFGALVVYGLVRRNPTLLKGSKRLLFVKHKNVDALVLPPKIPLRNDLIDSNDISKDIFTLTSTYDKLNYSTMKSEVKSVKSVKSGSPSYISAIQPTEEQLAEWRIKHHFKNSLSLSSRNSEMSTLSSIDSVYYYSIDENVTPYESLK